MKTCARAALCWALLCVAACNVPARRPYCRRADVALRAYNAPFAFEVRVQSLASDAATVRVKEVYSNKPWPRVDDVLWLGLPPRNRSDCVGRFEVLVCKRRRYIVFADRLDGKSAVALGPLLKPSKQLRKRIKSVYASNYSRPPRISAMSPVETLRGQPVVLECNATGQPPPVITWYKDGKPVKHKQPERHKQMRRRRVHNFRRRSILEITRARQEDSGIYECRAKNGEGPPAIAHVKVTVSSKRRPVLGTTTVGQPCNDPENSNLCLNGGKCVYFPEINEHSCQCSRGFVGQRCEDKDVENKSSLGSEPDWW